MAFATDGGSDDSPPPGRLGTTDVGPQQRDAVVRSGAGAPVGRGTRRSSPWGGLAGLWLGLLASSLPVVAWALWSHGRAGVVSVVGAIVVCGTAGTGAFLAVGLSSSAAQAWRRTLVGMALRLSLPLAACVFAQFFSRPLANAGFIQYVLFFYLVVLAIETYRAFVGLAPLRIAPRR